MKIISNFKDYYDFLIGKYGIDDKVVYERICSTEQKDKSWYKSGIHNPNFNLYNYKWFIIFFCGTAYYGHWYNSKIYYGKDAEVIPKKIKNSSFLWKMPEDRGPVRDSFKTDNNDKNNCPVLVYEGINSLIKNPKLSDYQFGKKVIPEDAYTAIYNFLSREKSIPDNQTNKEKIVSHGFDLKTSFRNM